MFSELASPLSPAVPSRRLFDKSVPIPLCAPARFTLTGVPNSVSVAFAAGAVPLTSWSTVPWMCASRLVFRSGSSVEVLVQSSPFTAPPTVPVSAPPTVPPRRPPSSPPVPTVPPVPAVPPAPAPPATQVWPSSGAWALSTLTVASTLTAALSSASLTFATIWSTSVLTVPVMPVRISFTTLSESTWVPAGSLLMLPPSSFARSTVTAPVCRLNDTAPSP